MPFDMNLSWMGTWELPLVLVIAVVGYAVAKFRGDV